MENIGFVKPKLINTKNYSFAENRDKVSQREKTAKIKKGLISGAVVATLYETCYLIQDRDFFKNSYLNFKNKYTDEFGKRLSKTGALLVVFSGVLLRYLRDLAICCCVGGLAGKIIGDAKAKDKYSDCTI